MLVNTIMSLPDDINLMNSEQVRFYLMTDRMSCEIVVHSSYNLQLRIVTTNVQSIHCIEGYLNCKK